MMLTIKEAFEQYEGTPSIAIRTAYKLVQDGIYGGVVMRVGGHILVNAAEFLSWLRTYRPRPAGRPRASERRMKNTAPRSGSQKEKRQTGLALC